MGERRGGRTVNLSAAAKGTRLQVLDRRKALHTKWHSQWQTIHVLMLSQMLLLMTSAATLLLLMLLMLLMLIVWVVVVVVGLVDSHLCGVWPSPSTCSHGCDTPCASPRTEDLSSPSYRIASYLRPP